MKVKLFVVLFLVFTLAAGCDGVELKKELPSSPEASYEALPR